LEPIYGKKGDVQLIQTIEFYAGVKLDPSSQRGEGCGERDLIRKDSIIV
jgi:hypothetical protein